MQDDPGLSEEKIEDLLDQKSIFGEESALDEISLFPPTTPPTIEEKILRKVENIFDILWEDWRARQSQDIMSQYEIEILLEGFRLGQKSQHK